MSSTLEVVPDSGQAFEVSATREIDKAARERARAEAERWLASLPSRTVQRGTGPGRPWRRLVMFRKGASTPEFWEKNWLVSPPYRMRGYKLPTWYRAVFTRWLPRDGLMLEAGCGNGNLIRMLVNESPEWWGNFDRKSGGGACVEGLDFAAHVIAENRRIHPEGRYRVGDVRDLPYGAGELSAYLSMGVVEHFGEEERGKILEEAARCLRPGGVAIITVPSFSPARRVRAAFGGYPRETDERRSGASGDGLEFYQYYFRRREIAGQIERAGLRVRAIDGYDCRRGWADAAGSDAIPAWIERRGKRWAARVEQPPRLVRLFCPHMLMLVAVKA